MVSERTQLHNSRDVLTGFFESIFCSGLGSTRGRYAPDHIADIVGHKQRTLFIQRYTHWPAKGRAFFAEKPGEHIERRAGRLAILEGYEDHPVATVWPTVP